MKVSGGFRGLVLTRVTGLKEGFVLYNSNGGRENLP